MFSFPLNFLLFPEKFIIFSKYANSILIQSKESVLIEFSVVFNIIKNKGKLSRHNKWYTGYIHT